MTEPTPHKIFSSFFVTPVKNPALNMPQCMTLDLDYGADEITKERLDIISGAIRKIYNGPDVLDQASCITIINWKELAL